MNANPTRALWVALAAGTTALFSVVLGIVLLGAEIKAAQCGENTGGPAYGPSAEALSDIPGNYLQLYQHAAAHYRLGGDGWSWLAAVGSIETDHGRLKAPGVSSGENSAGAGGPMQFLSGTWADYGVDGNRDGVRDRYDPRDAIPGAARYPVGTSRNPIDVADGGDGRLAPVDLHLMEALPSVRRSLLARWAGIVWLAAKILPWIRILPLPSMRRRRPARFATSWSLTVWGAGAAGGGAGRAARRCRAAQVSGQAAPIRAGAFDPVGTGNSVRPWPGLSLGAVL